MVEISDISEILGVKGMELTLCDVVVPRTVLVITVDI